MKVKKKKQKNNKQQTKNETIDKSSDFDRELKNLSKMRVTVIPVTDVTLGTC